MRRDHVVLGVVGLKVLLDMFSPYREINFVLTTVAFVLALGLNAGRVSQVSATELRLSLFFIGLCVYWYIRSADAANLVRYSSLVLVYIATRMSCAGIAACRMRDMGARAFLIFGVAFIGNYVVSFAVANPIAREFFNFEHANILGSYCLAILVFACLASTNQAAPARKLFVAGCCLLSTSTGAFILSLGSFFRLQRLRPRFLLVVGSAALVGLLAGPLMLERLSYETYTKVFGPIALLREQGFDSLVALARVRAPIQELGDAYQSSMTWRLYAYVVFFDFVSESSFWDLILGGGFEAYREVWGGMMPHNDYLLVLINFGAVGLALFVYMILAVYRKVKSSGGAWGVVVLLFSVRFLVENNISSFYLVSLVVMCAALSVTACTTRKEAQVSPGVAR